MQLLREFERSWCHRDQALMLPLLQLFQTVDWPAPLGRIPSRAASIWFAPVQPLAHVQAPKTWGATTKAPPLVEGGPYPAPPSSCLVGSSDASKVHHPYPLWPRRRAATFGSSVANSPLTNSTRGPLGWA